MVLNQVIPVHCDKANETVVMECLIKKLDSRYTIDFQCWSKGKANKCCAACSPETLENLEFQALVNMIYHKASA